MEKSGLVSGTMTMMPSSSAVSVTHVASRELREGSNVQRVVARQRGKKTCVRQPRTVQQVRLRCARPPHGFAERSGSHRDTLCRHRAGSVRAQGVCQSAAKKIGACASRWGDEIWDLLVEQGHLLVARRRKLVKVSLRHHDVVLC